MKGLKTKDNYIIIEGSYIEYGVWESDNIEKWAILDEDREPICYAIDDDYSVVEYDTKPEDYAPGKYLFDGGAWVSNPDYIEPLPPTEIRLEMLESDMDIMSDYTLELLYQLSLVQLGITEDEI